MLTCITLTILLNINQDQSQDRTRVRTGPESGQDQSQDIFTVHESPRCLGSQHNVDLLQYFIDIKIKAICSFSHKASAAGDIRPF